jgi:hypothetical protein
MITSVEYRVRDDDAIVGIDAQDEGIAEAAYSALGHVANASTSSAASASALENRARKYFCAPWYDPCSIDSHVRRC